MKKTKVERRKTGGGGRIKVKTQRMERGKTERKEKAKRDGPSIQPAPQCMKPRRLPSQAGVKKAAHVTASMVDIRSIQTLHTKSNDIRTYSKCIFNQPAMSALYKYVPVYI